MIDVSCDPFKEARHDSLEAGLVCPENKARDVRGDRENPALLREIRERHIIGRRRAGHERARDGDEQPEGVGFLLHASRCLRVKLPLTQVVALLDFVELLDFPPEPPVSG